MTDPRVTAALDQLRRDQHAEQHAALRGIATYARLQREREGATVGDLLEALRNVELHVAAVLGAGILPGRGTPTLIHTAPPQAFTAISVERCVELLVSPRGQIGRMRLDELLAHAIGREDAEELLVDHRLGGGRPVSSLMRAERARLANDLRARTRA